MLGYKKMGTVGDWVVCWPSLYNDHRSMKIFAQAISRDHRVLLIDPPGMGLSAHKEWPPLGSLELSTMGSEVIDKEIAEEPFHFIGHGIGGHVGLAIAVKYTNCDSLTISGSPLVKEYNIGIIFFTLGSILLRWKISTTIAKRLMMLRYSVTGLERAIVDVTLSETLKNANRKTMAMLTAPQQHTIDHHRELLQRINQPVLVIAGIHDKVVLTNEQRESANIAKLGTYREVESGFMTFLTSAAECSCCWLEFKRAVAARKLVPSKLA